MVGKMCQILQGELRRLRLKIGHFTKGWRMAFITSGSRSKIFVIYLYLGKTRSLEVTIGLFAFINDA